jgi:PAS domain S-box-containing protein
MSEELPDTTQLWQAFQETSPAGVAVFNRDMQFLQASTRWMRDFALEGQDIVGRSLYEVCPDIPERWKTIHGRCLSGAYESCDADAFQGADGQVVWLRWQVRPWRRHDAEIGGIVIFSEVITARVMAEQAWKDSEARYRAMIDQAPDAIIIYDAEGRQPLQANLRAEMLFGLPEAELRTCNISSFYHPEQPDGRPVGQSAAERELLYVDQLRPFERRIVNANGEEFYCEVTLTRLPVAEGNLRRVSFIDITARKKAEALLRQEEAKYRGLVEQQISGIVIIDDESRLAYANPYFAEMVRRPAEALVGQPLLEVFPPEEHANVVEKLAQQLSGEADFVQLLSRVTTLSGEIRNVIINATASSWEGRPASIAVVLDVTENRRLNEALRLSEDKYRKTINIAPVGIVQVDNQGRFQMANDFMCNLLGYKREELIGKSFIDVMVEEDLEDSRETMKRIMDGSEPSGRMVKRYSHRDGHIVWVEITYLYGNMYAKGGELGVAVINDITARKRAEEEGQRLAAKLQQAQKMEAIGQLTGGLAHDFNNLLAVILGNLDFLKDLGESNAEADESIEDAVSAALKGAELTRNLLAFARRQPLAPRLTEIGEVVRQAGRLFSRMLGEHITVKVDVPTELCLAMIDVAQFESAILNLAVNARDAMPNGGRLTIEVHNLVLGAETIGRGLEAVPGEYVIVSVSDTGTGMPPEVVAKVFEPFFTTKGTRGSGLGLSMVHGFVKQSGGHTSVYSELGTGTRIRIYLPRAAREAHEAYAANLQPTLERGHETVLVVEDNDGLRRLVIRRLADLGYCPIEARDAAEALTVLRGTEKIDLLFTDIVMPGGMDGRQLVDAAREIRPGVKVLFTTGFAAMPAGEDGHFGLPLLTKPYQKNALARSLRAAIDAR